MAVAVGTTPNSGGGWLGFMIESLFEPRRPTCERVASAWFVRLRSVSAIDTRLRRAHLSSDHDLALGSAPLEICKRFLGLLERKTLINYRPDAPRLEKLADLCELLPSGRTKGTRT